MDGWWMDGAAFSKPGLKANVLGRGRPGLIAPVPVELTS